MFCKGLINYDSCLYFRSIYTTIIFSYFLYLTPHSLIMISEANSGSQVNVWDVNETKPIFPELVEILYN